VIASKACSGPIPLRWAYLCGRSQEGSGEEGVFALCARGFGDRLQCSLRTDPATLGVFGALRGIGPTLAEEARGRMELSRCARGDLVIASKACSGPIPLRWAYLGCSAGSVLRTQEGSGEDGAFALCARGFGDRFQGSLRPDPATLGVFGRSAVAGL
jgi:hypothetical protein